MKAYLLKKTGSPSVLKISDVEEPELRPGQVKIRVKCIGLNYAEILSRKGQYNWAPKRPYVPGMEAYGEIVEVGEGVTKHRLGDLVITGSQTGSYAEYICVPEYMAFGAISSLSAEENAALLVNYMTAWVALVKLGKISSEDKVLIHAGAGGVGTAAIQIAKAIGAEVFATASKDHKIQLISDLGADHAINYAKQDFAAYIRENGGGIDLALEVVGGEVYRKSVELLNPFGRLVVAGFASISFNKWNPYTWWKTWKDAPKVNVMNMAIGSYGIMATHIGYLTSNEEIATEESDHMIKFLAQHNIKPVVGRTFSFDEMGAAHDWIESRQSVGKVVVKF